MTTTRRSGALILGCLFLLAAGPSLAPADARLMNITVSSSGLRLHGIPLPVGAEPTLAANMSLADLQVMAPVVPDLGRGRLQAVVYELQVAAPPDAVADFYRRELRRPVALALPSRVEPGKTPDDGIRVLPFLRNGGYLALRAEEFSRPSRVTVVMVEGSAVPAMVMKALDLLRTGGDGPKPKQAPPLLSPPTWEFQSLLTGARLAILQRYFERDVTPGPLVDVMRSLLNQAHSVSLQTHWVQHAVPSQEILTAFREEALRQSWRLVSVEAGGSEEVMALYRFTDDNGMVMLRVGRAQTRRAPTRGAPTAATEITRLVVQGPINFVELFRPIPVRVRPPTLAVPPIGTPPPRGPISAPSRR